jgi:hypothetical protein
MTRVDPTEPQHAAALFKYVNDHIERVGPCGEIRIELALLWQIFAADERDGIPKSVFQ